MSDLAVSIVIPTYNGRALLAKNLPAVIKAARKQDSIIIIDDASTDTTVDWLSKTYGLNQEEKTKDYTIVAATKPVAGKAQLSLIINHQNLRFGGACNRAVSLATTPLIFLINNDVMPKPDTVTKLVKHFEQADVFAVGCHEIEENKGGVSGGKNRIWFERGMFMHSRADDFETGPTAWASGGSAMFDRQKWLELGGFDQRYYPAYWEDVDLSFTARARGWQVLFDAEAIVYHNHETTHTDVFGQRKMKAISWKNARAFAWKHATPWQRFLYLLWTPYWLVKAG